VPRPALHISYAIVESFRRRDNPVFEDHFVNKVQGERKFDIEPHCAGDNLRRKTIVPHG
jgi:hypothetical protein